MKKLYIILLITSCILAQTADFDWRVVDSQKNYLMRLSQNNVNSPYEVASPYWNSTVNNNNIRKFWAQSGNPDGKDYKLADASYLSITDLRGTLSLLPEGKKCLKKLLIL